MNITVILCTYNRCRSLVKMLGDIAASRFETRVQYRARPPSPNLRHHHDLCSPREKATWKSEMPGQHSCGSKSVYRLWCCRTLTEGEVTHMHCFLHTRN